MSVRRSLCDIDHAAIDSGFEASADRRTGDNETAVVLLGHCAALTKQHRYAPAALACTPLITLDDLAEQLDSQ